MLRFLGMACGRASRCSGLRRASSALLLFAYLLTLAPSDHAGRAYAAYGGVYIVASLLWLWLAEGRRPDIWDVTGGVVALLAAAVILFAPRGS